MPILLMIGPPLLIVMLSRSVRFLAINRFSLSLLLSTRRFAPDAVSRSANAPSMLNVSFSFLLIVSPVLPANFRPSSIVATWILSITIRVIPSVPLTPDTPFITPMVPDAPGSPSIPAGPVRPIVPLAPLMATPDTPSLPFTPIKPSLPSSPKVPTLSSSPNATIRSLPAFVTLIFLLSPLIVTTSSGLTLLFAPSPESVRTNHPLFAMSPTS